MIAGCLVNLTPHYKLKTGIIIGSIIIIDNNVSNNCNLYITIIDLSTYTLYPSLLSIKGVFRNPKNM